MTKRVLREAFKKSLPVMAGYILLGIGFGVMLRDAGYGVLWALTMSIFIYAGALQYVGVGLIASGASILNTIITSAIINARHIFYAISMADKYKDAGKKKPYLAYALTDETYSLLCEGKYPEGEDKYLFFMLVSAFNHSYWIMGCTLGNMLGDIIPFDTKGIDFSMTAIFVVSFVSQWQASKSHIPALLGVFCTLFCLLIFGAENFLIPAMLLITALLIFFKKKIGDTEENYEP